MILFFFAVSQNLSLTKNRLDFVFLYLHMIIIFFCFDYTDNIDRISILLVFLQKEKLTRQIHFLVKLKKIFIDI